MWGMWSRENRRQPAEKTEAICQTRQAALAARCARHSGAQHPAVRPTKLHPHPLGARPTARQQASFAVRRVGLRSAVLRAASLLRVDPP